MQIDNTAASLNMAKANCLDPANEEYAESLKRLMKRIPEAHADALQVSTHHLYCWIPELVDKQCPV